MGQEARIWVWRLGTGELGHLTWIWTLNSWQMGKASLWLEWSQKTLNESLHVWIAFKCTICCWYHVFYAFGKAVLCWRETGLAKTMLALLQPQIFEPTCSAWTVDRVVCLVQYSGWHCVDNKAPKASSDVTHSRLQYLLNQAQAGN